MPNPVEDWVTDGIPAEATDFLDRVYASGKDDEVEARAALKQVMDNAMELYAEAELRYRALMDLYYSGPHSH